MELFVTSSVLRLSTVSRCSCVSLPGGSRVGDLVRDLLTDHGVPCEDFYVTTNGRVPAPEELLVGGSVYHLEPRLCGGKGGFGSMLRALGAQIEKTTNREACRDLSGRRLRDVNHEKEMAEWLKKQAELDGEKEQRRVERLQRKLVEPRHTFTDPEYQRQCHDLSERLEDSVLKGMQASSSGEVSAEAGLGTKRANKHPEAVPRKKKRFWNTVGDLDLQDSDEEDEEEEEEERPGPSHQTRPKRAEPFSTSSHQPGPVSTSPDQPEPISTGPEQSEPVPAGSSQPEPVSTSPEQPEPVSTNPEQPDPVPTGSDQPEPISTGPDQSEPVPTGSSQPEPISTSPEQPETICIDPDQPEPVCTDPGQPETLTRTNEDPQQSAPQVVQPMDLDSADGPEALEAAGLDQLKEELRARGLKCGGTLKERAARLFSVRGLRPEQVDPLLLAKTTGKKRK